MSVQSWFKRVCVWRRVEGSRGVVPALIVAALAAGSAGDVHAVPLPSAPSRGEAANSCIGGTAGGAGFSALVAKARCEVPPGGLPILTPLPEEKAGKDTKTASPTQPAPETTPAQPSAPPKTADSTTATTPPAPAVPQQTADGKAGDSKTADSKTGDGQSTGTKPAEPKAADATPPPVPSSPTLEAGFKYYAPGALLAQDAPRGRKDRHVYLPGMVFPLRLGEGQYPHMNSQIWGFGGGGWGGKGAAGGSECDPRNYDAMQQRDDYCEVRGWAMPMCPAGKGHQGQDIRPPTCKDKTWDVQAVMDGTITLVSGFTTVRLKANDGTTFEYLHMHPDTIKVKEGQKVKQGDLLGRVSNIMNGKRDTTMHLHFQVLQQRTINGKLVVAYVPTFPSLIAALRKAKGLDPGIDANGDLIADGRFEIGAAPPAPVPPAPKPEPPKPAPEPPKPAPEPPKAETPAPAPVEQPKPAPEPPKAETPQPAPVEQPKPAPEPPKADTPAPAPVEQPKPAPEPPKAETPAPAPVEQPKPAPEPPKAETPAPAPVEQPKPAPEPPKAETPQPAPVEQPKPAPEPPKAETPQPAPAPVPATNPPASKPAAPATEQKGWWQWTKEKAGSAAGTAKDLAGAAKDKVTDWWSQWRSKK